MLQAGGSGAPQGEHGAMIATGLEKWKINALRIRSMNPGQSLSEIAF
jgi:hypothetical protein